MSEKTLGEQISEVWWTIARPQSDDPGPKLAALIDRKIAERNELAREPGPDAECCYLCAGAEAQLVDEEQRHKARLEALRDSESRRRAAEAVRDKALELLREHWTADSGGDSRINLAWYASWCRRTAAFLAEHAPEPEPEPELPDWWEGLLDSATQLGVRLAPTERARIEPELKALIRAGLRANEREAGE